MPKEPYQDRTDVRLTPEMSRSPSHIQMRQTHTPGPGGPPQRPQKKVAAPQPNLNPYQARLLEELKSRPKVMDLLGVIFSQYPAIVVREAKQTSPNATNRQKREGRRSAIIRMQMETFIEEEIAKLAGIDIDNLQKEAQAEVDSQNEKAAAPEEKSKKSE